MRGRTHAVRDAGHAGRSGAARGAMTKNDPVPECATARGVMTKNDPVPKRTTRDGAAEAAPSRDASNYALGSCCVMQWMLPPP